MTDKLLNKYKHNLSGLELIPSGGGVFEVRLNEELLFSKKKQNRFPNEGEVEEQLNQML